MECLSDKVGLRVCGFVGDIYIDDLPEINLKKAAKITDEIPKASDFLKRTIEEAARVVGDDMATGINDLFQFNSVLSTKIINYFTDDCEVAIPSSTIDITNGSCDEYGSIRVNYVIVKPCQDTDGEITITGACGVDTYAYSALDGCETKIIIDKVYSQDFTIANAGDLGTEYFYTTKGSNCNDCGSCSNCGCCAGVTGDEHSGMQVKISCICDKEKFVCTYADEMKYLVRNYAAQLIFRESLSSDRLNALQVWNDEKVKADLVKFELEYITKKISVLETIRVSLLRENSECIDCVGLSYTISLP